MSYRKLKADNIFTGSSFLHSGEVLIVKPDGEIVSITDESDAGGDIEIFSGILSPGFVNGHCHLELSHMKGLIPEKTGLVDFVYRVINERHCSQAEIIKASTKAQQEMIESGIVAVGDICTNTDTLALKSEGRLMYYNFIEASGWVPSLSGSRWQISKTLCDDYLANNLPASVIPHAPYSVSARLWEEIVPNFDRNIISMHNQESTAENELFLKGSGDLLRLYKNLGIDNSFFLPGEKTSIQTCFHYFLKAASLILVHNTFISEEDIKFMIQHKPRDQCISFCLCPNANLYIEAALPPVEMLVKNNCSIILGTDSLASNTTLNILNEMKTIQHCFPFLTLETILQWATFNGASALQMEENIGSFQKGKKPGIVLIENVDSQKLTKESVARRIL